MKVLLLALALLAGGLLGCSNSGRNTGHEPVAVLSERLLVTSSPKGIIGFRPNSSVQVTSPDFWEIVSLAVPPNRAGCGPTGRVFFKPAGGRASAEPNDPKYGWGQVWSADLGCLRGTGSNCGATTVKVGNPENGTEYRVESFWRGDPPREQAFHVAGNDARLARLPDGTLLLLSQGVAVSPGGFEPRGALGFYASNDCGETWSLRSVTDMKHDGPLGAYHSPAEQRGNDYPYLHVDPWRGTVYVNVTGQGSLKHRLLMVSKDGAQSWTIAKDPATGLSPLPGSLPMVMTTTTSGEVIMFACEGANPTLWMYDPATGRIGPPRSFDLGKCSGIPERAFLNWIDGSQGIVRVINGTSKRVRVFYPTFDSGRQTISTTEVEITTAGVTVTKPRMTFSATSLTGSLIYSTVIEPDYLDQANSPTANPWLVYFTETTLTNRTGNYADPAAWGTMQPKAIFSQGTAPLETWTGPSWTSSVVQGDYLGGAFFYDDAAKSMGFVMPWSPNTRQTLNAVVHEWTDPNSVRCKNPGEANFCTPGCGCLEGEGDCAGNSAHCIDGRACGLNNGKNYGYSSNTDVCTSTLCNPNPRSPGHSAYCTTTCRCAQGFGDCDSDSECLPGLVCGSNNGAGFLDGSASLLPAHYDVCVPAHCRDGIENGDEILVDRGGACGMVGCPLPLSSGNQYVGIQCKGAVNEGQCDTDFDCNDPALHCNSNNVCACRPVSDNGGAQFCDAQCPCAHGRGLCENAAECESFPSGRSCAPVGGLYGMTDAARHTPTGMTTVAATNKVCLPTTCANQRQTVGPMSTPGHKDFCTIECPCARGHGNCDSDSECLPGLVCASDLGPNFRYSPTTRVCVPAHCNNGDVDLDEFDVDCGGSDCGMCDQPLSFPTTGVVATRAIRMYRRTTGLWMAVGFNETAQEVTGLVERSAIPVFGDFDANGILDRGLIRQNDPFSYYATATTTVRTTTSVSPPPYAHPVMGRYDVGSSYDVGWWDQFGRLWFARSASTGSNVLPPAFAAGFSIGQADDIPVPGDYDGNGRFDYATFRPNTIGEWTIRKDADGTVLWANTSFGQRGDIPLAGDFTGDGRSDIVVYRPEGIDGIDGTSAFYFRYLNGAVVQDKAIAFGGGGDIPVVANYDPSTAAAEIAVYSPATGRWRARSFAEDNFGNPLWQATAYYGTLHLPEPPR
jgi:hypothetical protein